MVVDNRCIYYMLQALILSFHMCQVWEGNGSGSIRFDAKTTQQLRLGTIAENSMLQAVLFERLQVSTPPHHLQDIHIESHL